MVLPNSIFGVPLSYIAVALIFGVVCAIGVSSLAYRPQPVQVQLNQYEPLVKYTPAPPPPAAVTTVPTQDVKYTVTNGNQNTGRFDPAQPPVVVTTAPLPTPTPTEAPQQPATSQNLHCSGLGGTMTGTMASVNSAFTFLSIGMIAIGLILMVMTFMTGSISAGMHGIISVVVTIVMFYVMGSVLNAITAAIPIVCSP